MPVQNYFQGMAPLGAGMGNALSQIAVLKQRDRALATDEQSNALMQQRFQAGQDAAAKEAEDEQAFIAAIRAGDLDTAFAIDPQTTIAYAQWQMAKNAGPAQLSSERVGGFEVLRDQTGKVYGQGRVKEGPSVVVSGGTAPAGKPPQGYRWTGGGDLEPIPGGPADAKTTQPLSPKDTNTARVKLTQVQIARNQLNTAKQRFEALRNSFSVGPGGNLLPTPQGKAFDAAIDSMRGSITALTRVPGVGAMSDYETRLDQAKFPTRGKYEDVAEQQLQALEQLLNTIESGYSEMLGSAPANAPAADDKPDPVANKGRKIRDKASGKVFVSDGAKWVEQ